MKEETNNSNIRLALNCVGGPVAARMAGLLGQVLRGSHLITNLLHRISNDAHLVSYGAMSKQPLSLPTSLFIFKNLICHGYWQSRWYQTATAHQVHEQMQELISLAIDGKV